MKNDESDECRQEQDRLGPGVELESGKDEVEMPEEQSCEHHGKMYEVRQEMMGERRGIGEQSTEDGGGVREDRVENLLIVARPWILRQVVPGAVVQREMLREGEDASAAVHREPVMG